jgi:hypothetical protein
MPLYLAPLLAFSIGAGLAWFERDGRPNEPPAPRVDAAVALLAGLVFAPAHAYFLWFSPDWSFGYALDATRVPSALSLVVALLTASLLVVGFRLARREARSPARLGALALGPLGLAALVAAALGSRLGVDATYRAVQGGYAVRTVAGSPLGLAIVWMDALVAIGVALTARELASPRSSPVEPGSTDDGAPKRRLGVRGPGALPR